MDSSNSDVLKIRHPDAQSPSFATFLLLRIDYCDAGPFRGILSSTYDIICAVNYTSNNSLKKAKSDKGHIHVSDI